LEREGRAPQAPVDCPLATLVLHSQVCDRHALLLADPDRFIIGNSTALAAHLRRIAKDGVEYVRGKAKRSGGAADALAPHCRLDKPSSHRINGWKRGEAPTARASWDTSRFQGIADSLGSHPERAGNLGNRLLLVHIHSAQGLALELRHGLPLITTRFVSALRVNICEHRSDRSNRVDHGRHVDLRLTDQVNLPQGHSVPTQCLHDKRHTTLRDQRTDCIRQVGDGLSGTLGFLIMAQLVGAEPDQVREHGGVVADYNLLDHRWPYCWTSY
jgi:hypothetical protein